MEPFNINPLPEPPALANLTWRKIVPEDLEMIIVLNKTCLSVDGGLPFLFEPDIIQSRYFPERSGNVIGALAPEGRLAACNAVHLVSASGPPKVSIVGLVHPEMRRKGIGTYLMHWSQTEARRLFTDSVPANHGALIDDTQRMMQIATESLTEPAHHLYLAHGFTCVFDEWVMRYDLSQPVPEHPLLPDTTFSSWRPDLAEAFYQAYHEAFRERPGFPGWSAAEWIGHVTENDHIPEWSLLARVNGQPAGFVIGNIDLTTNPPGGYVWQIGVIPAQRRRGLASALLAESLRRMQAAGSLAAFLLVHSNNPGAYQTYARLGFTTVGRRARYERAVDQKMGT